MEKTKIETGLSFEQHVVISRMQQLMDEMYGLMKHVPVLFKDRASNKVNSSGEILQAEMAWSFQNVPGEELKLVIESIRIGSIRLDRFDSSWDEWKWDIGTANEVEQSR